VNLLSSLEKEALIRESSLYNHRPFILGIQDRGPGVAKPKDRAFHLRGWVGIAIMMPVGIAVALTRPWVRPGGWEAMAFDAAAWLFLAAGLAFRLSAILFVGGRKGECLITRGPYSICRNPLYVGSFLLAVSSTLFVHSLTLLAGVVLLAIYYLLAVITSEERQLSGLFPEAWKAYVESVPRVIPRRLYLDGEGRYEVDLHALRNEALRAAGAMTLPIIAAVLNHYRGGSWWFTPWTLP
jgi:protein-S-isoprenylcysteine O-methyltransferase Ste14